MSQVSYEILASTARVLAGELVYKHDTVELLVYDVEARLDDIMNGIEPVALEVRAALRDLLVEAVKERLRIDGRVDGMMASDVLKTRWGARVEDLQHARPKALVREAEEGV